MLCARPCRRSARLDRRYTREKGSHSPADQRDRHTRLLEYRRTRPLQDFNLELTANGDLEVDQHHTVEDVGIVLGQAFDKALGNKKGILRAGYFLMPMDETMGMAAVDFCGRTAISVNTKVNVRLVGDLQSELVHDFFEGFARGARANVHTRVLYGRSNHHKIESLFKAFARAVRAACWRDKRMAQFIPSTKGVL